MNFRIRPALAAAILVLAGSIAWAATRETNFTGVLVPNTVIVDGAAGAVISSSNPLYVQSSSSGTAAAGTAATASTLAGCKYNSSVPAPTNGQQVAIQCDASGNLKVTAGIVKAVCTTPTVTATNAYGTNYVVGGKLTFANAFSATGSGVLISVAVQIKKVETSGFTFTPFNSDPSNSTWTDAAVAAINAADVFAVRETVPLTASSVLGTHTVLYGNGLSIGLAPAATSLYGVLTANAALTNQFGSTSDVQVCVKVLQDP